MTRLHNAYVCTIVWELRMIFMVYFAMSAFSASFYVFLGQRRDFESVRLSLPELPPY